MRFNVGKIVAERRIYEIFFRFYCETHNGNTELSIETRAHFLTWVILHNAVKLNRVTCTYTILTNVYLKTLIRNTSILKPCTIVLKNIITTSSVVAVAIDKFNKPRLIFQYNFIVTGMTALVYRFGLLKKYHYRHLYLKYASDGEKLKPNRVKRTEETETENESERAYSK